MVLFGFFVGVSYMNLSTMLALVLLPHPLRCCDYWQVLPVSLPYPSEAAPLLPEQM